VVAGGLKSAVASPERRVSIVTGVDTAVQPASAPLHEDEYAVTLYSELGTISAPTTAIRLGLPPGCVSATQSR
jgi:hypothetical protein